MQMLKPSRPSASPNPMNHVTRSRIVILLCAFFGLAFAAPQPASARIGGEILVVSGSGQSTITSLVENPDDTLSIEAYQVGHLSGIGAFVGYFSYVAHIDYNTGTTLLIGSGYLVTSVGDQINLSVRIVQGGVDYPRPFAGILTVQGGTGRFAGASGHLTTSGFDEESLTDRFQLYGVISTLRVGSL
jgi:hypothetical protein